MHVMTDKKTDEDVTTPENDQDPAAGYPDPDEDIPAPADKPELRTWHEKHRAAYRESVGDPVKPKKAERGKR